MQNCDVCGISLTRENCPHGWGRCAKHYRCDDCGTKDNLCTYTEGVLCDTCHTKRVEGRIAKFKSDTQFEKEIICPWCGYIHGDSWECDSGEYECEDCGNKYEVERDITVYYSTAKVQSPSGVEEKRK